MENSSLEDLTVQSFEINKIKNKLSKWGAAVIPKWLNNTILENLREEWKNIREKSKEGQLKCVNKIGGKIVDYAALYCSRPDANHFKTINRVFKSKEISKLINSMIGKPCVLNEEIYATYDIGNDQEIASSHFDKTWTLKCMIYLDDMLEKGLGSFGVHPGSQYLAREKFREWYQQNAVKDYVKIGAASYYEMKNDELPQELNACVDILAPAGSLIIFSTDVYHRGGFLEKGKERRILRGHSYPGYRMLDNNFKIKKRSRHYLRGENLEILRKKYNRFSLDGLYEWIDHKRKK